MAIRLPLQKEQQLEFNPNGTPAKLADIFGELGDIQTEKFRTQRAPIRNQKLGELAATNRLSSGIAEHTLGALDRDTALGEADIRGAAIPQIGTGILQDDSQEFQSTEAEKEFNRNLQLSKLIGKMNKPSGLSQIFQGVGQVGQLAGGVAGLASGNPLAIAPTLSAVNSLAGSGGAGGSDLAGIFGKPSLYTEPDLNLFNKNATGGRRYF